MTKQKAKKRTGRLVEAVYYENDNSPHCPCLHKLSVDDDKPDTDSHGVDETDVLGKHFYFKRYCPDCGNTVKYFTTLDFKRIKNNIFTEEQITKAERKRAKKGG